MFITKAEFATSLRLLKTPFFLALQQALFDNFACGDRSHPQRNDAVATTVYMPDTAPRTADPVVPFDIAMKSVESSRIHQKNCQQQKQQEQQKQKQQQKEYEKANKEENRRSTQQFQQQALQRNTLLEQQRLLQLQLQKQQEEDRLQQRMKADAECQQVSLRALCHLLRFAEVVCFTSNFLVFFLLCSFCKVFISLIASDKWRSSGTY